MIVTKSSQFSKKTRSIDIQVTSDELKEIENCDSREDLSRILSDDDYYFIKFGITPDEWNEFFNSDCY